MLFRSQYDLEVAGTLKIDKLILGSDARTSFGVTSGAFSIDTINLEQIASYVGGPVGIGTTTPNAHFTATGSWSRDTSSLLLGAQAHTHLNLGNASTTGSTSDSSGYISISGGYSNVAVAAYSHIGGGHNNYIGAEGGFVAGGKYNKTLSS